MEENLSAGAWIRPATVRSARVEIPVFADKLEQDEKLAVACSANCRRYRHLGGVSPF